MPARPVLARLFGTSTRLAPGRPRLVPDVAPGLDAPEERTAPSPRGARGGPALY